MEDKKAITNTEGFSAELRELCKKYELFTYGFLGMMGDPVGDPNGCIIPTGVCSTLSSVYNNSPYAAITKTAFHAGLKIMQDIPHTKKIYEKLDNVIITDSRNEN